MTGIQDKLEIDRRHCERLGITRPEVVYTAVLERLRGGHAINSSNFLHLVHLYVLADFMDIQGLSRDAMTRILEGSMSNFQVHNLVPVLWYLAFEKYGNTKELEKLIRAQLKKNNLLSGLTLSKGFRANLENRDFSRFIFDLVSEVLGPELFTAKEILLLFWGIGSRNLA